MRPSLAPLDLWIVALYGLLALALGAWFSRRAGRSVEGYFVGGRDLPWWLAGTSIVATTFAADTPLAVTGLVATGGLAANWLWWSWAVAHVLSTFFFARLWRRSRVVTDAEVTELRYGGRPAAWLRGFKAVYFGVFVNALTMAWVIAAMVKISRSFFDVEPAWVIAASVAVAVLYTVLGGFRSVVATDFVQFALGMGGAAILAWRVVEDFGGMGSPGGGGLLGALGRALEGTGRSEAEVLSLLPSSGQGGLTPLYFAALLLVGWWRYAEGNGYLVQRLAACRDEAQAQGAALWFAVAHNALRPWPWFVVALAALVVYPPWPAPEREALVAPGPGGVELRLEPAEVDPVEGALLHLRGVRSGTLRVGGRAYALEPAGDGAELRLPGPGESGPLAVELELDGRRWSLPPLVSRLHDREMGYPLLMGRYLPPGLLGLVVASLVAAFMSTIDTHTNWGASYLVRDLYLRFWRPGASEREAVLASRLFVVALAVLAGLLALVVRDIASVWVFLLELGAGLGSVAALRWYWPRVTAWAEFAALGAASLLALGLLLFCTPTLFGGPNPVFEAAGFELPPWARIAVVAGGSLAAWLPVALWGPREDEAVLRRFARRVRPPGRAWAPYRDGPAEPLAPLALRAAVGLGVVYGALFGIGWLLLGRPWLGAGLLLGALTGLAWVLRRPAPAPPR